MQVTAPSDLVPVRNMQPGPTVFRDAPNDVTVRWEGAGDPQGQDWQYVPESYRQHPYFAESIRKGVLAIGTYEDATQALIAQDAHHAGSSLEADAAAAIHRPEVNDFLTVACIGPGTRQGLSCGLAVPIKQSNLKSTPPLCDNHSSLAGSYVPIEGSGPDGLPQTTWAMTTMTAPVTEAMQTGPVLIAPPAPGS